LAGDRGTAYRTDLGQLEIMRRTDGVGDYTQWALNAAWVDIGDGHRVLVGSASDLLAAKEAAGREKDLKVLPRIRAELLALGALAPACALRASSPSQHIAAAITDEPTPPATTLAQHQIER